MDTKSFSSQNISADYACLYVRAVVPALIKTVNESLYALNAAQIKMLISGLKASFEEADLLKAGSLLTAFASIGTGFLMIGGGFSVARGSVKSIEKDYADKLKNAVKAEKTQGVSNPLSSETPCLQATPVAKAPANPKTLQETKAELEAEKTAKLDKLQNRRQLAQALMNSAQPICNAPAQGGNAYVESEKKRQEAFGGYAKGAENTLQNAHQSCGKTVDSALSARYIPPLFTRV